MKKFGIILLSVFSSILFFGCGEQPDPYETNGYEIDQEEFEDYADILKDVSEDLEKYVGETSQDEDEDQDEFNLEEFEKEHKIGRYFKVSEDNMPETPPCEDKSYTGREISATTNIVKDALMYGPKGTLSISGPFGSGPFSYIGLRDIDHHALDIKDESQENGWIETINKYQQDCINYMEPVHLASEEQLVTTALDLSFLENYPNLIFYDSNLTHINEEQIKNLRFLPELRFLELDIDLPNTQEKVTDISTLGNLKNLIHLSITRGYDIKDFSPIGNLKNLILLSLQKNTIQNIDFVENLKDLRYLVIYDWDKTKEKVVSDISALENLEKIEILHLINQDITDISPLKNMQNLIALGLEGNPLSDISVIKNFPILYQVDLSNTNVEDISVIADMHQLKYINLENTLVEDISPLLELPHLEYVNIKSPYISEDDCDSLRDHMAEILGSSRNVEYQAVCEVDLVKKVELMHQKDDKIQRN